MTSCGILVEELYFNYKHYPISISLDESSQDVQSIPFPAVTIFGEFPFEIYFKQSVFQLAMFYPRETQMQLHQQGLLIMLAVECIVCHNRFFYDEIYFKGYEGYENLIPTFIRGGMSQSEWFKVQQASWNGKYSVPFAEIQTKRGMGWTFNMLDAEDLLKLDQ